MRSVLSLVLIFTGFCAATQAAAQEPFACLGNNSEYTVAVGAQYTDEQGLWTCDPGADGATTGGWVLSPAPSATPPATPTPTLTPVPTVASVESADSGVNMVVVPGFIVVAVTLIAAAALFLWRRRTHDALTGTLSIREVRRGGD